MVFVTASGRPFDQSYINGVLHRSLERAGLPSIRVHDLRHTAATYLSGTGVHPKIVQDMLGHSSISLTIDTYRRSIPSLNKEAAASMDALMPMGQSST